MTRCQTDQRPVERSQTPASSSALCNPKCRNRNRAAAAMAGAAALAAILLMLARPAVAQVPPGGYKVPNLTTQFGQISPHGDALGFHRGVGDDPWICKHYQGVARSEGTGRPYLFLTRSGNHTGSCAFEGDDPGELLVVKMTSRDTDGERLRTNKALRGKRYDDTEPESSDKGVAHIHFNNTVQNGTLFPGWGHPGGCQLVDHVLFVPVEHAHDHADLGDDSDAGGLVLVDVSSPEAPTLLKDFTSKFTHGSTKQKVGVAAATRDPVTGKYLILVTGGGYNSGGDVEFWETTGTNLHDPNLDIVKLDEWESDNASSTTNDKWGSGDLEWQTVNFVRGTDDQLYLVCIDNATLTPLSGTDWARLFRVTRSGDTFTITYVAERHLKLNAPEMGDGDAAGGAYVSPTGNLILYTTEHENDGQGGHVRMGEFRNYNVNHTGTDSCWGWVEIYDENSGWNDSGARSFILDYKDRTLDNWEDLRDFEDHSGDLNGFSDATRSVRWAIPPGRSAALYADEDYEGTRITLVGDGTVHSMNNINDTISVTSLRFEGNLGGTAENVWVSVTSPGPACSLFGSGLGVSSCPFYGPTGILLGLNALAPAGCVADPTVFLFPGNYNQKLTISRRVSLKSAGGLVRIGAP